ncbi:MAG: hypothetical protein ACYC7F_14370 [Gemmatimonadaceae bacterium]
MKDRLKRLALLMTCIGTLGAGRAALGQDTLRVLDHLPRDGLACRRVRSR